MRVDRQLLAREAPRSGRICVAIVVLVGSLFVTPLAPDPAIPTIVRGEQQRDVVITPTTIVP